MCVYTRVQLLCCWQASHKVLGCNTCVSCRHCWCVRQPRNEARCTLPHALHAVLCMACLGRQALQPPTSMPLPSNIYSMTPSQVAPQIQKRANHESCTNSVDTQCARTCQLPVFSRQFTSKSPCKAHVHVSMFSFSCCTVHLYHHKQADPHCLHCYCEDCELIAFNGRAVHL